MKEIARRERPKMIIAGASAYARIIDFEPFAEVAREIGAKFMVDMAHIAGLVATGFHPSPIPHADAVTTTTHKTLRGPRGGLILCKAEHAKAIDKAMFPGTQGGPLEHVIAAKAVALKEALDPSFKEYCGRSSRMRRRSPRRSPVTDFEIVSGGTDNHLMLVDLRITRSHGQGRREGARSRGDHGQQEHGAEGDAVAVRDERNPHRHAGGDDARNEGSRDGSHRRPHRPRSRCAADDAALASRVREDVERSHSSLSAVSACFQRTRELQVACLSWLFVKE